MLSHRRFVSGVAVWMLAIAGFVSLGTRNSSAEPAAAAPPPPAGISGDLDQCRNGGVNDDPIACTGSAWVNGNAGEQNAHYSEGGSIVYRIRLFGMTSGQEYTLDMGYDTKHSGAHAIDFLTTSQRTAPFQSQPSVDPCNGVSAGDPVVGTCPVPATGGGVAGATFFVMPNSGVLAMVCATPDSLGYDGSTNDDALQPCTAYDALSDEQTRFMMVGGSITGMLLISQQALDLSQAETRFRLYFTASASTAVISWGGHIGSRKDWGFKSTNKGPVPASAGGISGSPYHMRLKGFCTGDSSDFPAATLCEDGGNQDRSLSAAAVVPPPDMPVSKFYNGHLLTNCGTPSGTPPTIQCNLDDINGDLVTVPQFSLNLYLEQSVPANTTLTLVDGWPASPANPVPVLIPPTALLEGIFGVSFYICEMNIPTGWDFSTATIVIDGGVPQPVTVFDQTGDGDNDQCIGPLTIPDGTETFAININDIAPPVLNITKTVRSITYDYVVTNTGPVTVTGISVTDPDLDGAPSCSGGDAAGTINAGGTAITCTGTMTATLATGDVTNTGTASGTGPTGETPSDTDDANVTWDDAP